MKPKKVKSKIHLKGASIAAVVFRTPYLVLMPLIEQKLQQSWSTFKAFLFIIVEFRYGVLTLSSHTK